MGNYVAFALRRTYAIHARSRCTDRYDPEGTLQIDDGTSNMLEGEALGMFKREAHAMALTRSHEKYKAIYLYHGNSRIARAGYALGAPGTFEVSLASPEVARHYDTASERLACERWPLLERAFYRAFRDRNASDAEAHPCTRVFYPVATGAHS